MITVASLNRDGRKYDIEMDEHLLAPELTSWNRLARPVVKKVDFQFDDSGNLRSATVDLDRVEG